MSGQKRVITFLIFIGLFSASYQIGALWDVPQEDAEAFMEEFEALLDDIDGFGIFLHNLMIGLPMAIPGFGVAWGFFTSWQTGYAFAAIVKVTPFLADVPALALLYLSPFGMMELIAYSLAMSRSFLLAAKLIKKQSLKPDAKVVGIEIGIVVGLLLAGGFLEMYMIEAAQEAGIDLFSLAKSAVV